MAAFRTLWTALVGLYEETLVLLGGNVAALVLNLPIALLLVLLGLGTSADTQWVIAIVAWGLMFVPTPANVALAGLAQAAASPDVPRFAIFRTALRRHWRLAAGCSLVSLAGLVALVWYVVVAVTLGWPPLIAILWLYATLFWLSLHLYVAPLAVHVAEPRLVDLYRRAALISLGHPGYTFMLLILLLIVTFACVVFLPVYVLVGLAFVSLVQAHALREIRRRHGDLTVETEDEVGRL